MSKLDFVALKDVVEMLEEKYRRKYVERLRKASRDGLVDSLPVETSFDLRRTIVRNHIILNDERYQQWHGQTVRDLKLGSVRGAVAYTDDLKSGATDFKSRVEEYRKAAQRGRKPARKRKLRPGEMTLGTVESPEENRSASKEKSGS